jgi:hypothetical protein
MALIKQFFGFLLFASAFYVVALFITFYFIPSKYTVFFNACFGLKGNLDLRLQEANNYHNVDVVFLGASDTYRGFDTRIFDAAGIQAFNLGSSVQTPIQTEVIFNRYFDRLNPKVVVYAVHPSILSNSGTESSGDLIFQSELRQDLFPLVQHQPNLKVINTLLYKSTLGLFNLEVPKWSGTTKKDDYIKGGFCQNIDENAIDLMAGRTEIIPLPQPLDYQLDALKNILAKIKNKNIPLILVMTPRIRDNRSFETLKPGTRQLFEPYGQVIFGNDLAPFIDSLDFYDSNHLSQNGVNKFNAAILPYIQATLRKD